MKYGKKFVEELNRSELYEIVKSITEECIQLETSNYEELGKKIIAKLNQEDLISLK